MSERNPFGRQEKGAQRREMRCEEWETLLADALDGMLLSSDHALFTAHSSTCATCSQLLDEAKQGQEWLQFLHTEPEMPGDLMERILGKTSGAIADRPLAVYGAPIAAGTNVLPMPVRRMVWDTRLMMTAAMAFFSIALTLNLAGVRITALRLSDLTPASLETNLTRQFYGVKSQVVRYYDNLRFVYEVESKMRELRRDEETVPPPVQQEKPPANPPANGHKNGGKLDTIPAQPKRETTWGHPVLASIEGSFPDPQGPGNDSASNIESRICDEVEPLVVLGQDQAERGLA